MMHPFLLLYSPPHLTENDKSLYATMNRWRIDPSSYPDVCSVDDMGVCSAFELNDILRDFDEFIGFFDTI